MTAHMLPDEQADEIVDRYTVRSVARAMKLIELVAKAPKKGLQLSDLARDLPTSKTTTWRWPGR